MINITQRQQEYIAKLNNQWLRLERSYYPKIYKILTKQARDIVADIKMGITDFEKHIMDYKLPIKIVIKNHAHKVGAFFYKEVINAMNEATNKSCKDSENIFWASFDNWMNLYAAEQVVYINSTTRKGIRLLLQNGIKDGLSANDIGKKINKIVPPLYRRRGWTIAKTETHSLYSEAVNTAVKSTKVKTTKTWFTAGDERVRDRHILADGETVEMNEPFLNTGEALEYPGDPNGSGDNIIQCRCSTLFNTKDF